MRIPLPQTVTTDHYHRPLPQTVTTDRYHRPLPQTDTADRYRRPLPQTVTADRYRRPLQQTVTADRYSRPLPQTVTADRYPPRHRKQAERNVKLRLVGWLVGCLTSQQHATLAQGRICSGNFACCHTEIQVAEQSFHLTQPKYTDTGPTSPSADPIAPGAWQGVKLRTSPVIETADTVRVGPGFWVCLSWVWV